MEKKFFFEQMVGKFLNQFTPKEIKKGVSSSEKKTFLERGISPEWLTLIIDDTERFSKYWSFGTPFSLKKEYNNYIQLRYKSSSYGFLLEFDKIKCTKQLADGDQKAFEIMESIDEGYKLKNIFGQAEQKKCFQQIRLEMQDIKNKEMGKMFNRRMMNMVFEDIQKRAELE